MSCVKSLAEISLIVLSSINQLHTIPEIGNIIQPLLARSLVQYDIGLLEAACKATFKARTMGKRFWRNGLYKIVRMLIRRGFTAKNFKYLDHIYADVR